MSWPNIAKCYEEIVKGPSLLELFSEKECALLLKLPDMGALQFRLISEKYFTHVATPDIWGKAGVEFINTGLRASSEATPTAILITDGVKEGYLGMVTIICHHDQVKMKAMDALAALCQCDSPEPTVVMVR